MNFLRYGLVSILFLPTLGCIYAQQIGGKPVLSAEPPAKPVTSPPAANPSAGVLVDAATYIIGADDSLKVDVYEKPDLSGTLPVRPDGKISLPLLGDIEAAGFTPMQLAADITNRLKKFVVDPVVDVTVMSVNSKRIFLIGEINHVGPLALTPGMTMLQAISAAGGLTAYAHKNKIYILRGEAGKQQKIPFDYSKAVKKGDMQGVTLQPGDTIVFQ